jgi:hypothetical protein
MTPKAPLCIPLGHKWKPYEDPDDPELRLRCLRCGRTQAYGSETHGLPSFEQRMQPTDRFGNKLP